MWRVNPTQVNFGELFESQLVLIDRVIATVCRRNRLYGADAEDFASSAKIALMENDYAVLRKFSGRSSLAAYLGVVVQNFFFDQRTRALGRWHPSREAERLGEAGVLLEMLLHRDRRTLDEAWPLVRHVDATVTRERAAEMASRLPRRSARPQPVELDENAPVAGGDEADRRVVEADLRRLSSETNCAIRRAMAALPDEDATILRLRFGSGMTVSDISRILRLPQRPLYRRLESLIERLRAALEAAGIDVRDVAALIGESHEMDFGLADGKSVEGRQSSSMKTRTAEEGR